jgi:hypothetical protein
VRFTVSRNDILPPSACLRNRSFHDNATPFQLDVRKIQVLFYDCVEDKMQMWLDGQHFDRISTLTMETLELFGCDHPYKVLFPGSRTVMLLSTRFTLSRDGCTPFSLLRGQAGARALGHSMKNPCPAL